MIVHGRLRFFLLNRIASMLKVFLITQRLISNKIVSNLSFPYLNVEKVYLRMVIIYALQLNSVRLVLEGERFFLLNTSVN